MLICLATLDLLEVEEDVTALRIIQSTAWLSFLQSPNSEKHQ